MPTFEYIAINPAGKQQRGSIAAESASAARKLLRTRRLHATTLRPIRQAARQGSFRSGALFRGRRRRIVLEFTRQLATMIQADIQLTEALSVLFSQTGDPKFSQVLQNIRDELLAGESFADGLKEYPNWFDPIFVAMVRIGEVTGNMGRSLGLLADYLAKRHRVEAKVKAALTYPAILVVIAFIVTLLLMTVVLPKITGIITKTGRPLPAITKLLMDLSNFLIHQWWLALIIAVAAVWLFRRLLASPKGRLAFDRFKLKIPIIGELLRQTIVARFTSTLAALIRSGLPVAEGLQVVSQVIGNAVMADAVQQARDRIIGGADIATPLRESQVVGSAVAHMISVGEKTGELETMLLNIAESIEENTDITVQRISSVIEPVIIVIMAVVIGFIAIATMLPILQAADISKL